MKILIAHNYYQQAGGEDHCVTAEVAMLQDNGHEVIRYSLHNDAIESMGRLQIGLRTIWSRTGYHDIRETIRARRPDVVHFNNTFPLISPAAYYAARAEGVPVVQTLHNFRLLCPNALFFRDGKVCEDCLGKSIPWPGVVHKCYRGSRAASATVAAMVTTHRAIGTWRNAVDAYITLTEFGRKKFIEGGLPAAKLVVKPNFVYPDPGPGAGKGGYAIYVGRLSEEKGVETLLTAWKTLGATVPLTIVGGGPLADLVARAATPGSGIESLGSRPLDEVYRLIGEASVLVLPSQCYENFPRVVIEAYAKGTPVIASDLGAMAHVVDHGRTGRRFVPGDPTDLICQVRGLLADAPELDRMRQTVRREYEQHYTAQTNYRTLMAIYEGARAGIAAPAGAHREVEPRVP